MIPELKSILVLLEKIAPSRLAESWDNPGLQVGSYVHEIGKIYIALDPTLDALRSAHKREAQMLLTHHPLVFGPLKQLDIHAYPGNVIAEAITKEISVVTLHTNLDVAKGGINDILADLLDLQEVEILKETDGMEGVGLGRIGKLPGENTLQGVVERVKRILGRDNLKVVGREDARVGRLAVVGGSGGSLVSLAFEKGADLLLTGDTGYHHALEAEALGIALIDGGHFHTENTAFRIFGERLKALVAAEGWEVMVEVDTSQTEPMRHC
ncbi:MAG: Nif3-like dinuclear metal center hexameric protein [Deltaproteobacteria bacterium]|nr:Nif3-like dinuclear metal center hexameric protein [Deltaproteobacteria bacterium]